EIARECWRQLHRLVLAEAVLDDRRGEESARDAAPHVVARRDRQERARVVVESDGVREAGGFDRLLEKPQHPLEAVVEPPRRLPGDAAVSRAEDRKSTRLNSSH